MIDIAIESLETHIKYDKAVMHTGTINISMAEAENILKLLKEQEAVVRCKDCKHGEKWNAVYACGKSRGFGTTHKPDWFCADGEKVSN